MKKFISLVCVFAFIFTLAACGSSAPAASGDDSFVVGICQLVQQPALDSATEERILTNLRSSITGKRTVIFITHRQTVADAADAVVRLSAD